MLTELNYDVPAALSKLKANGARSILNAINWDRLTDGLGFDPFAAWVFTDQVGNRSAIFGASTAPGVRYNLMITFHKGQGGNGWADAVLSQHVFKSDDERPKHRQLSELRNLTADDVDQRLSEWLQLLVR